jgi:hypothetical protein
MKARRLNATTGVLTETAIYTNEADCDRAGGHSRKIPRIQDEPTMFMKGQQLSSRSDILTELQVTQNKQLTRVLGGQSATEKRF